MISRRSLLLATPALILARPRLARAACVAAQYPALLNAEAIRPPWRVAGVDFGVGFPAGQAFKIPGVDAPPAGVTVDTGAHLFTVTGNGVLIDGWDFSVNNGWGFWVQGNNCIIQNSNFKSGSNGYNPLYVTGQSATVQHNVIDSNNVNPVNGPDDFGAPTTVRFANGANVLQFNWIKNAYWDLIDIHGGAGLTSTYLIRYNLLDQCCQTTQPNSHCDWLQTYAGDGYASVKVNFNTCRAVSVGLEGTQGWTLDANSNLPLARFGTIDLSFNTVTMTAPSNNYIASFDRSITSGSILVSKNFLDLRGEAIPPWNFRNAGGPSNGPITGLGNTNMVDNTQPASWNF
jgi:hypothetical protein